MPFLHLEQDDFQILKASQILCADDVRNGSPVIIKKNGLLIQMFPVTERVFLLSEFLPRRS